MKKQQGFTLIELMISLVIGIIISLAALSLFLTLLRTNTSQLKAVRLNQEIRSAMSIMVRDIRRSGHNRSAATNIGLTNPYSMLNISNSNKTINFSYDEANTGTIETYGYTLDTANGTIRSCTSTTTACSNWEDITDGNLTNISDLSFTETTTSVAGVNLTRIAISITGNLRSDTAFTRTMQQTVEVRN